MKIEFIGGPADGDYVDLDYEPKVFERIKIASAYKSTCIYEVIRKLEKTKFEAQFVGISIPSPLPSPPPSPPAR